jgi:hypothetical protein
MASRDLTLSIDAYDFEAAVAVLYQHLRASPHLAPCIDAAVDAIWADAPGWMDHWIDDGVLRINAGPALLALCTDLIEGRA